MLCNLFWTFSLRGVWLIKPLCANTRTHPPTRPRIIVLSFSETEQQRNTAQNIFVLVFHRVLIAVSIYMHFIRSLYTNKSDFWLKSLKTQAVFMIRDTNVTVCIFFNSLVLFARYDVKWPLSPLWSRVFLFIKHWYDWLFSHWMQFLHVVQVQQWALRN